VLEDEVKRRRVGVRADEPGESIPNFFRNKGISLYPEHALVDQLISVLSS
jgi:hypothetical protein